MKRGALILGVVTALMSGCSFLGDSHDPQAQLAPHQEHPSPATQSAIGSVTGTLEGIEKIDLWVNGPHLRGANIWQALVIPDLDGLEFKGAGAVGPPFTQKDFDDLAALGANYVSISGPGLFTEEAPYHPDPDVVAHLDSLLAMIAKADMFATIGFRTGPGRSEYSLCCEADPYFRGYFNDSIWEDAQAQEAWVEMWRYTAERYRNNPIVVGYKLMVEPNAPGVIFKMYDPDEFFKEYGGSSYDWNQLYPRILQGIRQVDLETPVLVSGTGWSGVNWLPYLEPLEDSSLVYVVHQYEPQEQYTHQVGRLHNTYPGTFDTDYDRQADSFDREWLDAFLAPIDDFRDETGAPVAVDEYGVMRWEPGAPQFLQDEIALFEVRGLNHAIWEWSPSWPPFADEVHDMNYRLGTDPDNRIDDLSNEVLAAIRAYWELNTVRPSQWIKPAATDPDGASTLDSIETWLYLIDVNLEEDVVDQIANSRYDMVVLDYIPSEVENTDYPMAKVISQLQEADHPKLVLAYIDIGEAESYRTYWQEGWRVGDPEWIAGEDPDGWEGNYPVAYWDEQWQNIWLGAAGYLQGILDAGFDGVYLDWVEAYSNEEVLELADEAGVDPISMMIDFVGAIATYGRSRAAGFIVIGQNAAELAAYDEYIEAIDAIAQEQTWFDGGADNKPAGDCPLPRTEAEIDSASYRNSLSLQCRWQYEAYPESTLHVSSEWYLDQLQRAREKGLVIFTVDYALDPDNVAWVYARSRELGFIPFVSSRALDRFVPVFP